MHQTPYLTILPLLWVPRLCRTCQPENWQMSLLVPHLPVVSRNDQLSLFWTNCLFSWPVVSIVGQLLTQLWPLRPSPHAPSPRSRTSSRSTCTTAGSPTSPSPPSTDSTVSDFFASQAMLLAICPLHRWPATTNTSTILTRSTYCLFLAEWARASGGAESGWQLYWGEIIFVTKLWLLLF